MSIYACTAETQGRGRCRNAALEQDPDAFCTTHAQLRDSGTPVKKATRPGKVLVKANINPNWTKRFLAAGIPEKTPDFAKREAAHVEHAQSVGREAYAVRKDIADSGVQVFGKEGVTGGTLVVEPLDSLLANYRLTDIHIFVRRDKGEMHVLCLTYELGTEGDKIALPVAIAEFFAMSSWGYCHIWANPPKDGVVIHTLNLSHRSDDPAKLSLQLSDGLWAAQSI